MKGYHRSPDVVADHANDAWVPARARDGASEGCCDPSGTQFLETCWRIKGPSGCVLECAVYRTDVAFEVRASYLGHDDIVRSEIRMALNAARELADQWRWRVLAKDGFELLRADHPA